MINGSPFSINFSSKNYSTFSAFSALGEVDRARAILVHASQYCDPRPGQSEQATDFWEHWKRFEMVLGSEDDYREMRRIRLEKTL